MFYYLPLPGMLFIETQYGQRWAARMADLLLEIKKTVATIQENGMEALSMESVTAFEQRYEEILSAGYLVNPRPPPPGKNRKSVVARPRPHRSICWIG